MSTFLTGICLLTIIVLTGCSFPGLVPVTQTPTAITSHPAALTLDELKNYTYLAPQYNRTAPLKNGTYTTGSGADIFTASLLPQVAFGDLNGDGIDDAAVLLAENGGGTGEFVSLLTVLNPSGAPMQVGSMLVDDRPIINSLTISNGKIILGATIHGPNDPMVSPTFMVTETFQLINARLLLTRFTSKTPDGTMERSIQIDSPVNGTLLTDSIEVKGSMPIGPFENTLAYRIYDESGYKLAEGPFMVNSDGTGGAATFDAPIDIFSLPKGMPIRLELVEVSMADGSTLALDSVELVTQ